MIFDTTIRTGTIVSFPGGSVEGWGTINFAARHGEYWLVATDRTPIHPLSLRWPDQPADHGEMNFFDGAKASIMDAWTGLVDGQSGALLVGDAAHAIKRGEGDWNSVVVHVVVSDRDLLGHIGSDVGIIVDKHRRDALSRAHSAVHLAALALNAATQRFWTKEYADLDSLRRPNLDKAAVERSSIEANRSSDVYRLGKSLKKKGFDRDRFLAQIEAISADVNEKICDWLAVGGEMVVSPTESTLDEVRKWRCSLEGTIATIPCGGTHMENLSDIGQVRVALVPSEDGFEMRTEIQTTA